MLRLFQSQAYKNKEKRTKKFVTKVNNSTNSNNPKLQNLINITIGNSINNSKITEAKEFYKNFDEKLKKILYQLEEHERSGNLIPNYESKITFFLKKTKYIYEYKDILIQILKLQKLKEITNIDEITEIILNFISLIEIYDKLIKKFSIKYTDLYTAFKKNYNKKKIYNGNSKKFNNNFKEKLETQKQYNLMILTYRAITNLFIKDILKEFATNYYNITENSIQTVRRLFEQYNYIKYYKIFLNLYAEYNPSYMIYIDDYHKELKYLASYSNKIQAYAGQKVESISSSVTSFGQRLKSVGSEIASSALKPLEPAIASSSAIASSVASSVKNPYKQQRLARKTFNNAVSNELIKELSENNYSKIGNNQIYNTLSKITSNTSNTSNTQYKEIIIIIYNRILSDFRSNYDFKQGLLNTSTKIYRYKNLLDKLLNLDLPYNIILSHDNISNIIKLIIQYIHYIIKYKVSFKKYINDIKPTLKNNKNGLKVNNYKELANKELINKKSANKKINKYYESHRNDGNINKINTNTNTFSTDFIPVSKIILSIRFYNNIKDFFIKNILERLAHYLIINFKYDEKLRIDLLIQIYTIFMERLKKNTNSTDEDNPEKIFDYFFKYLLNPYHFNKNNNEQTKLIKFLAVENKKMLLKKLEEIKSESSTSEHFTVEGITSA